MVIAGSILEVLPEVGALVVVQGSSRIDSLERAEYQSRLAALAAPSSGPRVTCES
jgi:hypothetical protein